ncbi:cAMP-specific phosphodiesterase, putative [Bodo saltans]|uniref:Phosphodiesterase n=1 Tax=Bodo saltans TaxID=75058 RepID=A0A0S4KIW5_BODSA|nr:cAMP-specific phosphodiesterase, putative [Bodo saltans]|eukprot:CUI14520.1 cAMP-specific phosphodiesterase, putative [Bodo saltans]
MLAELQKSPSLYATTKDNVVVLARMSADAQRLVVCAALAEGKSFEAEFNEASLTALKPADFGWDRFFEELQGSFNSGRVSSTSGAFVEITSSNGSKFQFSLEQTSEDIQRVILNSLLNYHHIHTHSKEIEKQLEEAGKQEQEVRMQAADLEREEVSLKESIARNKEQEDVNQRRLAELNGQLAAAEDKKRKSGAADVEEEDEELTTCRCRIPLGEKDCKDVDAELLKLVKGRWTDGATEADSIYNSVARPYTSSELTAQTSSFSSAQRQAIWQALEKIDDWDYDVFNVQSQMSGDDNASLAIQANGGSLLVTGFALMFRHGLMQKFKIDERILLNWLTVVEAGYHGNPYHNSMHAADVLHITHYILSKGGLAKKCKLTDEDMFGALFAAIIHDYDHPGINNSFHVKTQTYLATLYNDRSVLENRHVSSVFELMKLSKFNVLSAFTDDQRRDIRDTVIEMVLSTDMGLHAKIVNQFKRRLQENHDFTKKDDIRLALSMAVKMADISNCGRPEHIYLKWSGKIADEFYMQGDRERNLGLPCSPFMDRSQPAMAKGQIAFMNYIVVPLFECISEFLPDMHFSVDHTEQNKAYWNKNDDS